MDEVFSPAELDRDPEHAMHAAQAIARAHRDVPFYIKRNRLIPKDGASLEETLAALPVLTKQQVRATLPKQWIAASVDLKAELAAGAIELMETSGSTAERLRILWDRGWWQRQQTRAMHIHPNVAAAMDDVETYKEAILATPVGGVKTCHIGEPPLEERLVGPRLFLNMRPDPTFWKEVAYVRMLDELGSQGIVGLESEPMYAASLARYAAKNGRRLDVQKFVQLTYSSTAAGDLRAIEEVFAGPIVQLYSAIETGSLFMQGADGLLHHAPYTTHVELLPAKVPTPGAKDVALVVVTTMDRRAQPLVRFVVGDLVQVANDGPRLYTNVPPLRSVEGRVQDAIVRPDGAIVTAGALDRALDLAEIARFQANQSEPDRVEIDLLLEEGAQAASARDAAEARLAPLLVGLQMSVRTATAMAVEASGKFRLARRSTPIDLAQSFAGYVEEK